MVSGIKMKEEAREISEKIVKMRNERMKNGRTERTSEDLWQAFTKDLKAAINKHIPTSKRKRNTSLPWLNRDLLRQVRKKQRLYNQAKRTQNWTNFNAFQKEVRRSFEKAEQNYVN